jgi:hypothetical protein
MWKPGWVAVKAAASSRSAKKLFEALGEPQSALATRAIIGGQCISKKLVLWHSYRTTSMLKREEAVKLRSEQGRARLVPM